MCKFVGILASKSVDSVSLIRSLSQMSRTFPSLVLGYTYVVCSFTPEIISANHGVKILVFRVFKTVDLGGYRRT